MPIATATPAEVYAAWAGAMRIAKILQPYVQGSANGATGNSGLVTPDEVETEVAAQIAALDPLKPAGGG